MEVSLKIKVLKNSKLFKTYYSYFSVSNTTTLYHLKDLSRKKFSLPELKESDREVFFYKGEIISEKRVVPSNHHLEYVLFLEEPSSFRILNRKPSLDEKDLAYSLSSILKEKKIKKSSIKLWPAEGWWGDQGETPECVGYAWAHWLDDQPSNRNKIHPLISPNIIYLEAKKLDAWPGENYEGTSVRGGVKYLKSKNQISKYHWGFNLSSLTNAILHLGPVVVGTSWYQHMFFPNKTGLIKVGGNLMGGHAYVINGIDLDKKIFRIKNSWGQDWGLKGHAWISFSDMARLIREDGEICFPS